mmetsp:Transcript_56794/g.126835  ORF Transcript_56794/g.126835 Transcript_56794/m.126835 type:complete len:202 (-) Transcript_56794:182-787(-)
MVLRRTTRMTTNSHTRKSLCPHPQAELQLAHVENGARELGGLHRGQLCQLPLLLHSPLLPVPLQPFLRLLLLLPLLFLLVLLELSLRGLRLDCNFRLSTIEMLDSRIDPFRLKQLARYRIPGAKAATQLVCQPRRRPAASPTRLVCGLIQLRPEGHLAARIVQMSPLERLGHAILVGLDNTVARHEERFAHGRLLVHLEHQ